MTTLTYIICEVDDGCLHRIVSSWESEQDAIQEVTRICQEEFDEDGRNAVSNPCYGSRLYEDLDEVRETYAIIAVPHHACRIFPV